MDINLKEPTTEKQTFPLHGRGEVSPEEYLSEANLDSFFDGASFWQVKGTSKELSYMTHGLFRFFGKFPPPIADRFITKLHEPKLGPILDPMMGSGTTLVEAMKHGRESIGADINPLAVMVSRVKTTPISWQVLVDEIPPLQTLEKYLHSDIGDFIPSDKFMKHWFNDEVRRQLAAVRYCIESLPRESSIDNHIYDLLRVAFVSIIRKVSNASNGLGRMFKDPHKKILKVFPLFRKTAYDMANAIQDLPASSPIPRILNPISVENIKLDTNVGLVICHPPYFNLFRYSAIYKFELLWIGYDPKEVRKKEIREGFKIAKAELVDDYVHDLKEALYNISTMMSEGAHLVLMIGDAIVKEKRVNTTSLLLQSLGKSNLEPQDIIIRIPKYTAASYMSGQRRKKAEVGVKIPDHLIVFKKV